MRKPGSEEARKGASPDLLASSLIAFALERALSRWAEAVLASLPPPPGRPEALAIDGKTLRGS